MSELRPWLGDERPSLDEVCEQFDVCNEECPAYEFCQSLEKEIVTCKDCKNSPKTYEEYCIGQSNPDIYCPDAYTDKSHLCGYVAEESEDK